MSTYFITKPEQLHISAIRDAVSLKSKMSLEVSNSGTPVITLIKEKTKSDEPPYSWLHLDIDPATGFMITCFTNGRGNPSKILAHLEEHLGCRFFSEHEPEYWGVNSFEELECLELQTLVRG